MPLFSALAALTGTVVTPVMLFLSSAGIVSEIGLRTVLDFRPLFAKRARTDRGPSPLSALSLALAGTLGVGNITGVASALTAGGPGAVFWMWAGAIAVIPVKYAEVLLAVRWRRRKTEVELSGRSDGSVWTGGAMYYIRDGLSEVFSTPAGRKNARKLASLFACLCAANALVTGNLVQANAAVCLLPAGHRGVWGLCAVLLIALSVLFGTKRIEGIAARLMPPLTAFYMAVCTAAIAAHIRLVPGVFRTIFSSAFSLRAAGGGILGFTVREAVRFGVMRGIFSNEAGCGTSPSAHAAADTDSAHRQALLGVVEVIFDTLVLCTLTALVLLTADAESGFIPWHSSADAAPVSMEAFRRLAGSAASFGIRICAVLFAYASIIAQIYYGLTAVCFLTEDRKAERAFLALSVLMPAVGAYISSGLMWLTADLLLGVMTAVNCSVLLLLRGTLRREYPPDPLRRRCTRSVSSALRPFRRSGRHP